MGQRDTATIAIQSKQQFGARVPNTDLSHFCDLKKHHEENKEWQLPSQQQAMEIIKKQTLQYNKDIKDSVPTSICLHNARIISH